MVDFKLTDDGDLELQAFGERSQEDIWAAPIQLSVKPC